MVVTRKISLKHFNHAVAKHLLETVDISSFLAQKLRQGVGTGRVEASRRWPDENVERCHDKGAISRFRHYRY